MRRSRSRSGFGIRGDSNLDGFANGDGSGFGSFDHGNGGLLSSSSRPKHSRRTRLNRVRNRVSGAAKERVTRFKKLPRAAKLFRLVAAMLAFTAASNVLQCGSLLSCGGAGSSSYGYESVGYEPSALAKEQAELYVRNGDETLMDGSNGSGTQKQNKKEIPKIPKLIHQTYKSNNVPEGAKPMMRTWVDVNPGWTTNFYDDKACVEFVKLNFPEYWNAYSSLPKDVERSDFFRYLVVLKHGGVYSDIDTESRVPLDSFIRKDDSLVVGWEGEFETDEMAYSRHFVRRRQVLNWAFAGAPGHPALREICDHIANNFETTFSNNTNRDTLERTGPGPFTDVVLKYFWKYSRAKGVVDPEVSGETGDRKETKRVMERESENSESESFDREANPENSKPWRVRVLPKVSFGTHPSGEDGVSQSDKHVLIAHKFSGSWKSGKGWSSGKSIGDLLLTFYHSVRGDLVQHRARSVVNDKWYAMPAVNAKNAYPVCTTFDPPFDMLTHLLGSSPVELDGIVSGTSSEPSGAALTMWGSESTRVNPTAADALVGSLETMRDGQKTNAKFVHLVDVNAGLGYLSLAAASRGFRVSAVEPEKHASELFTASTIHNGFDDLIEIQNKRVGGTGEKHCAALVAAVSRQRLKGSNAFGRESLIDVTEVTIETLRVAKLNRGEAVNQGSASGNKDTVELSGRRLGPKDVGRKYKQFDFPDLWTEPRVPFECPLADELGIIGMNDLVSMDDELTGIGALRVASDGWELHNVQGAYELLTRNPPNSILLEITPARLYLADDYEDDSSSNIPNRDDSIQQEIGSTLKWLQSLGYTNWAHAGEACERRRSGVHAKSETENENEISSWCSLTLNDVGALCSLAHTEHPETILLKR